MFGFIFCIHTIKRKPKLAWAPNGCYNFTRLAFPYTFLLSALKSLLIVREQFLLGHIWHLWYIVSFQLLSLRLDMWFSPYIVQNQVRIKHFLWIFWQSWIRSGTAKGSKPWSYYGSHSITYKRELISQTYKPHLIPSRFFQTKHS